MTRQKVTIALYEGGEDGFQLFKFLKRPYLGYMVLKLEYVPVMG